MMAYFTKNYSLGQFLFAGLPVVAIGCYACAHAAKSVLYLKDEI